MCGGMDTNTAYIFITNLCEHVTIRFNVFRSILSYSIATWQLWRLQSLQADIDS